MNFERRPRRTSATLQARIVAGARGDRRRAVPPRRMDAPRGRRRHRAPDRGRQRARARRRQLLARHGRPAAAVGVGAARGEIAGRAWEAMGVSLVLHPRNPYAPTVHLNVRMFVAHAPRGARRRRCLVVRRRHGPDAVLRLRRRRRPFPSHLPRRAAPFGADVHPRYKRWCDEYFYLQHRQEPRGVGGIFYDDLNDGGFDHCFALTRSVGDHFLDAYAPILARRKDTPYGERERDFQAYRRGRYVEFNLVWDRGTLFGLQSNGRTEAILMSLPPMVKWRYDWKPAPGTPEARLTRIFWWRRTGSMSDDQATARDDAHLIETQGGVGARVRRHAAARAARHGAPARRHARDARIHRASGRRAGGAGASRRHAWSSNASTGIRCSRVFIEFPAGKLDPGESPLATGAARARARRPDTPPRSGRSSASSTRCFGYSTEAIEFYVAEGLTHVGAQARRRRVPRHRHA